MSSLEESLKRYQQELPIFIEAANLMAKELEDICRRAGVLAVVSAREKTVSSFVKKALAKSGYKDDAWNMTTDKVGARIIVETLSDRDRIIQAITTSALRVSDPIDKEEEARPNENFYPGIHLQSVVPGVQLSDGGEIECEIQVRTKAQDLWSVPSHKLIYKGIVTPAPHTARRIWRLQTLTALFDEEVHRAIEEVSAKPGFEQFTLISIAEDCYYTFVPVPGDRDLSYEILLEIGETLVPDHDFEGYRSTINEFAKVEHARLSDIYMKFGESSKFADDPRYWLFTQPESILIFEGLHRRPDAIRDGTMNSEFGDVFEPLFRAWGITFREPSLF